MKAIKTQYRGYNFRSRLESRWAVYLDSIGLQWEYEKEGFDLDGMRYLPDFWLPQVKMWAEVKPEEFSIEEKLKMLLLTQYTGFPCIMLIGTPEVKAYDYYEWDGIDYIKMDCILSMYKDYPLTESRFYASCGGGEFEDEQYGGFGDVWRAVRAARSARFEYGESGASL